MAYHALCPWSNALETMAGVVQKFFLTSMVVWMVPIAIIYGFNIIYFLVWSSPVLLADVLLLLTIYHDNRWFKCWCILNFYYGCCTIYYLRFDWQFGCMLFLVHGRCLSALLMLQFPFYFNVLSYRPCLVIDLFLFAKLILLDPLFWIPHMRVTDWCFLGKQQTK